MGLVGSFAEFGHRQASAANLSGPSYAFQGFLRPIHPGNLEGTERLGEQIVGLNTQA